MTLDPELEAQAQQWTDNFFGKLELHPLKCPTCQVKFGVEITMLRFAEQTESVVWCPRGHQLKAVIRPVGA